MTREELDQFLDLQRRIHERAMELLKPYCETHRYGNAWKWIEGVDLVNEKEIELRGWDGSDAVCVTMPTRYLYDDDYRSQMMADAEVKWKAEAEKQRAIEEKKQAMAVERERREYERLRAKFEPAAAPSAAPGVEER